MPTGTDLLGPRFIGNTLDEIFGYGPAQTNADGSVASGTITTATERRVTPSPASAGGVLDLHDQAAKSVILVTGSGRS